MRLIAALLVVVSHTFPLSGAPAFRITGVEDLGALGVSIFFVISGFLVSASYVRDPKTYLIKRILRIEPGLIASLVVTVVALGFVTTAPAAEYWPKAAAYVARNALLFPATYELPGVFQAVPLAGVVNGVLWTLRPKGSPDLKESEMMEAGKAAGLVDVKVVAFSDVLTAEKFVIPVAARAAHRPSGRPRAT